MVLSARTSIIFYLFFYLLMGKNMNEENNYEIKDDTGFQALEFP